MKYLLFIILSLSLVSCGTTNTNVFTPEIETKIEKPINKIIKDSEPSFDENEQNSGIIDYIDGKGWVITKNAALRYNILINKYGKDFSPAITKDFGLSEYNKFFLLTQQGMINFALLNQKHKAQIK